MVWCFNPDLSLRWEFATPYINIGGPSMGRDGTLVLAGRDNNMWAFRSESNCDPGQCEILGECYDDGSDHPDNDCLYCDVATAPNTWTNAAMGTRCGDTMATDCSNPDTCDGAGQCQTNHLPNGTACADEPFLCTVDHCQNGTCLHEYTPVLTPEPGRRQPGAGRSSVHRFHGHQLSADLTQRRGCPPDV